jgi:hypothetical protein
MMMTKKYFLFRKVKIMLTDVSQCSAMLIGDVYS